MKGIKTLVSATAIAVCMGAASMASAATVGPDGPFSATGTIKVKSPSSFQAEVTCPVTASGTVANGVATITSFSTASGSGLCQLPQFKNLPSPGWVITASSATAGTISNVGYTIAGAPPLVPATNCGPSTIAVTWAPSGTTGGVLSATNQALSGSCTVTSLSVTAPTIVITP